MSQIKVTDLTYLKDASGGNDVFVKEMVEIFLRQTPNSLTLLKQLTVEKNWEEFRKVIHKMKPTISMMGIHEGSQIVKDLEHKVKNLTDLETVAPSLKDLELLCEKSYLELRNEYPAS